MNAKLTIPITCMLLLIANWTICTETYAQDFNTPFIKECKAAFLKKEYKPEKEITITKDKFASQPFVEYFANNGLQTVQIIPFSAKPFKSNGISLSFRIIVYRYNTAVAAIAQFNTLKTDIEDKLSKDYDYVVRVNKYILRMDGPCVLSQASFDELTGIFALILAKQKPDPARIECTCGGHCIIQ